MNESQHHRGPDDGGLHLEPGVGLGHRRLSIIDLATGQQPLFNEDGSVVVVFNGEIYNYQELIPELTALGHVFRTKSDTEVIVHAWEAWGEACVERFRGMFAFALWDRNRETLFLARDRLGVKPLYYALLADGTLIFGSELKSLARPPRAWRASSTRSRSRTTSRFGYVAGAAHRSTRRHASCRRRTRSRVRRGQPVPAPREYWDVRFTLDNPIGEADAQAELIERLRESVRLRMISEVPLGAFLSGGVDSSAVVATMAGLSSEQPVNTCSIAFGDPAFDESRYAREVAERYRTRHFVDNVDSDDFDLIDTLARTYDEPYADSSAIPTYRVCQLARRHVTVALSGDGGDESFGGYRRYRLHADGGTPAQHVAAGGAPAGVRAARPRLPEGRLGAAVFRAKTTFEALARSSVEAYFHSDVDPARRRCARGCSATRFKAELGGYDAVEVFHRHAARAGHRRSARRSSSTSTSRPTWSATSTPRSTARAWRIRSRCASR